MRALLFFPRLETGLQAAERKDEQNKVTGPDQKHVKDHRNQEFH